MLVVALHSAVETSRRQERPFSVGIYPSVGICFDGLIVGEDVTMGCGLRLNMALTGVVASVTSDELVRAHQTEIVDVTI